VFTVGSLFWGSNKVLAKVEIRNPKISRPRELADVHAASNDAN
jgi:hypothetical protein